MVGTNVLADRRPILKNIIISVSEVYMCKLLSKNKLASWPGFVACKCCAKVVHAHHINLDINSDHFILCSYLSFVDTAK